MDFKIKKLKSTIGFFAISPVLAFLKPLVVSILDSQAQFGNYTLVIVYSIWFSYLLNSGIYEGLLKKYSQLVELNREDEINILEKKISSFWVLILITMILGASFFATISRYYFFSAGLLLSFSTISFNVYSAKHRALGNIFRISLVHVLRLSGSLLITYILILKTKFGLDVILFIDALFLCFISLLVLLPSYIPKLGIKRFYKVYVEIACAGRSLTYVSALRAFCLVLERQLASLMFKDSEFSQYAKILLLFNALIVFFGLIPQLWQQKIMYWTRKNGVKKSLVRQSYFILSLLFLWVIFWIFVYLSFPIVYNPLAESMTSILIVGCAGIIYGGSFIDSILLGTKRLEKIFFVYVGVIVSWSLIITFLTCNTVSWSLEYQASSLLLLCSMVIIAPSVYIIYKNPSRKSIY